MAYILTKDTRKRKTFSGLDLHFKSDGYFSVLYTFYTHHSIYAYIHSSLIAILT